VRNPQPYFAGGTTTLYLGDMREVLPTLDVFADCVITDPPYAETGLAWDRWPAGWVDVVAATTASMWCFGSMRMFLARHADFAGWQMSQDAVWEKNAGSGMAADRLRRVHEHALHWYRGRWSDVHHVTPRVAHTGPFKGTVTANPRLQHQSGGRMADDYTWSDDGTRQLRSVIKANCMRGKAIHPTEKPVELIKPLLEYACPPGGLVLDPFAGSGGTAVAAQLTGRRTVLIEADERYCEAIAKRLSAPQQLDLASSVTRPNAEGGESR
jgi:site-specific DNA-methyltransferase (adenine-specific)